MFKRPAGSIIGGNPNGFPDYKPFNKLPRDEQNAELNKILRPILYQVFVEERKTGNSLAVFPRVSQQTAEALASTINLHIALGKEKLWSNAIVSPVL